MYYNFCTPIQFEEIIIDDDYTVRTGVVVYIIIIELP